MPFFEPWIDNRHRLPRYQSCRQHAPFREEFVRVHIQPGDQLLLVTNNSVQGSASEAAYEAAVANLAEPHGHGRPNPGARFPGGSLHP